MWWVIELFNDDVINIYLELSQFGDGKLAIQILYFSPCSKHLEPASNTVI